MTRVHKNLLLTDNLNGFMIGSLLGDGCFVKKSKNHNTYVKFSQCENQINYLIWKYNYLKKHNLINNNVKIKIMNQEKRKAFKNAQNQYYFSTKSTDILNKYKIESKENLIKEINELGLIIYIMDDGNFYKKVCKISCGTLNKKEKEMFITVMKDKFNLNCSIYNHPNNCKKDYFRFLSSDFEKIKEIFMNNIKEENFYEEKLNTGINEKEIKIKYFSDINKIETKENSDWVDLRSAIDIDLKAGEFKLIPLGVGMILPYNHEAHIVPRSSTFKNFGIIQTNHQAVIDESYCGDNDQWFYPVYALRDTHISKNDRICQFRIVEKQPKLFFEEVFELKDKDRGGHGSSGIR